jgi:hypothetical protein
MKIQSKLRLTLAAASLVGMAAAPAAFAQSAPQLVTNGPQVSPGDESGNGSGRRNVIDSKRYEQTLRANTAFREQRMRKECGSIDDQSLHEQCVASFH